MIKVRTECAESPCYLCDFACNSKHTLAHHTSTRHNTPDSLVCTYCQSKLKDVSSVRRHIRTVHINKKDYKCTYCNKMYKHKFDLEKHFAKKHESGPMVSQNFCSECKLRCIGWDELQKHYLDAHGKTIQHIKCPQCYKIFFEVVYLKGHFKRVHNNKTMSVVYCQHCGAVFEEDSSLVRHMEDKHMWNGENAVFCREDQCDELFEDVTELENHVEVHHSKKRVCAAPGLTAADYSVCPECSDILSTKLQFVAHLIETHHWRSVMECQRCLKVFPSTMEVQEHLNTHYLEPEDAPLLPSGKHSILKKRLLKRKNIKDLSKDLEPRFFVGFVRLDDDISDMKEPALQQEVEVETNNKGSYSGDAYQDTYSSGKDDIYSANSETSCHGNEVFSASSELDENEQYSVKIEHPERYSVRNEQTCLRNVRYSAEGHEREFSTARTGDVMYTSNTERFSSFTSTTEESGHDLDESQYLEMKTDATQTDSNRMLRKRKKP